MLNPLITYNTIILRCLGFEAIKVSDPSEMANHRPFRVSDPSEMANHRLFKVSDPSEMANHRLFKVSDPSETANHRLFKIFRGFQKYKPTICLVSFITQLILFINHLNQKKMKEEQIEMFSLPSLRLLEVHSFLQKVSEKTNLLTATTDKDLVANFVSAVNNFAETVKPTLANSYTQARTQADSEADFVWAGLRYTIQGLSYHPQEELRNIGKKLFPIVQKYGAPSSMSYDEQYPNMRGLIKELNEQPAADLAAAGLPVWLSTMQEKHDKFVAITSESISEENERQVGISNEMRLVAQDAYANLIFRVNALRVVVGKEHYAEFIGNVNIIIHQTRVKLSSRDTRNSNDDKKEKKNKKDDNNNY